MQIVCISDTHGMHNDMPPIPDGDVIIHAGDFVAHGYPEEYTEFYKWFRDLPHGRKILVAGNHERALEAYHKGDGFDFRWAAPSKGIDYLFDSGVEIDGVKFWGSPWQPDFCNWAFNLPRGEKLAEKWALIPSDVDVLITHGPPHGCCDSTAHGEAVGCADLLARIIEIEVPTVVCGHIHEGYGRTKRGRTSIINASICTVHYRPINDPIVIVV